MSSATEISIDAAKTFLLADGFRMYALPEDRQKMGQVLRFQRRIEKVEPVCATNDKLTLNVTLYETNIGEHVMRSLELEIVGEMPDGEWAKLLFYGLPLDQLSERLPRWQARLVQAWKASCVLNTPD